MMNKGIFQILSETNLSPLLYTGHRARLLTANSNESKNYNSDMGLGAIENIRVQLS